MEGIYQKTPKPLESLQTGKGPPQIFCVLLALTQQIKVLMLMVAAHIIHKNFRAWYSQKIRDFLE